MVSKKLTTLLIALFSAINVASCSGNEPNERRRTHRFNEPIRNLVRVSGLGLDRGIHYRNPAFHSCYYNPWSPTNTPHFAFGYGEPDCHSVRGCHSNSGYFGPAFGSQAQGPLPEISEPQFPPSNKNTSDETESQDDSQQLLDDFSRLQPPAKAYRTQAAPEAVSVLKKLNRK